MAVTVTDLALDLRLITSSTETVDPAIAAILGRHLAAADNLIESRAPNAPDALKDAAAIAIGSYLFDRPTAAASTRYADAWTNCGASSLLARYVLRRARVIAPGDGTGIPGTPGGPGVDQEARDGVAANSQALTALDAVVMGVRNVAEAGFMRRLTAFVEGIVPAWARAAQPPAANLPTVPRHPDDIRETVDFVLRGRTGGTDPTKDTYFWNLPNFVPDTPGTQSGIGHVLTVTGEDDKDYRWRANDGGQAGVDAQARSDAEAAQQTADAAKAAAATADGKAVAAQDTADAAGVAVAMAQQTANNALVAARQGITTAEAAALSDATVIIAGPVFVVGEFGQRNLYLSVRHPLNAYSDANILDVRIQGLPANLQAYDPNTLQADYTVGITADQMKLLADAGHLVEGNFVYVEIRLTKGREGELQFFRGMEVEVVAAQPPQTGRLLLLEDDNLAWAVSGRSGELQVRVPASDAAAAVYKGYSLEIVGANGETADPPNPSSFVAVIPLPILAAASRAAPRGFVMAGGWRVVLFYVWTRSGRGLSCDITPYKIGSNSSGITQEPIAMTPSAPFRSSVKLYGEL